MGADVKPRSFFIIANQSAYSHVGQNRVAWDGREDDRGEVTGACHWRKYQYICTIHAEASGQDQERIIEVVKEILK